MTDRVILAQLGGGAARQPDTKSFRGDFGLTLRVRRDTFEEAEALAVELLRIFPDDTIHIDRRIARVKMKAVGEAA